MKSQFRNLLLSISYFVFSNVNGFAQKKDGVITNETYIVEVIEKNSSGRLQKKMDQIYLKSETVSSMFSVVNNFSPAVYSVTTSSMGTGPIFFSAQSEDSDKNILKWSWIITDKHIEGKAVKEEKGKVTTEYSFTGILQEKK